MANELEQLITAINGRISDAVKQHDEEARQRYAEEKTSFTVELHNTFPKVIELVEVHIVDSPEEDPYDRGFQAHFTYNGREYVLTQGTLHSSHLYRWGVEHGRYPSMLLDNHNQTISNMFLSVEEMLLLYIHGIESGETKELPERPEED